MKSKRTIINQLNELTKEIEKDMNTIKYCQCINPQPVQAANPVPAEDRIWGCRKCFGWLTIEKVKELNLEKKGG